MVIFIEDNLKFKPYLHKKTLARGTIVRTVDDELLLIDDNNWECSENFSELNYYCFKIETSNKISLNDYNTPRFRMINQQEVKEYTVKKYINDFSLDE